MKPGPHPRRLALAWRNVLVPTIVALFGATGTVAMLAVRFPTSLPYDDGLNEFSSYIGEIGRLLAEGNPPVLTARSFSGGNLLIDFERAPFHPVTLVTAAVDRVAQDVALTAAVFAILTLAASLLGGWYLGRAAGLSPRASAVVGLAVGTSPVLVYLYATNWWNGALGTAALAWAVAALVGALRRASAGRLVALAVTTTGLFLSGWPHAMFAFAVVLVVVVVVVVTSRSLSAPHPRTRFGPLALPLAAVCLGSLVALPQLSEYLVTAPYLARELGLGNGGNNGVPPVTQVVAVAFPSAGDWWAAIGPYDYWRLPVGFVSLLALVAVFFVRWSPALRSDRVTRGSLILAAIFGLLTQLPERFGPLQFPFRFLPVAGMFVALAIALVIERGEPVWSRRRVIAASTVFAAGTFSFLMRTPSPRTDIVFIALSVALVGLVAGALVALGSSRLRRPALAFLASGGAAFILLTAVPPGERQLAWAPAPSARFDIPEAASGFILSVGDGDRGDNAIWPDYISARYLRAEGAIINGYDPVGQAAYRSIDAGSTVHGMTSVQTLDYLTGSAPVGPGCRLDDWRITAVITYADAERGRHAALEACGFRETRTAQNTALFEHPRLVQTGTASTTSAGMELTDSEGDDLTESVRVRNLRDEVGIVNFARMWWPGYSASLDGVPLDVETVDGISTRVAIPGGSGGVLVLRYWPVSWSWSVPCALTALVLIIAGVVFRARDERRARRATAPTDVD